MSQQRKWKSGTTANGSSSSQRRSRRLNEIGHVGRAGQQYRHFSNDVTGDPRQKQSSSSIASSASEVAEAEASSPSSSSILDRIAAETAGTLSSGGVGGAAYAASSQHSSSSGQHSLSVSGKRQGREEEDGGWDDDDNDAVIDSILGKGGENDTMGLREGDDGAADVPRQRQEHKAGAAQSPLFSSSFPGVRSHRDVPSVATSVGEGEKDKVTDLPGSYRGIGGYTEDDAYGAVGLHQDLREKEEEEEVLDETEAQAPPAPIRQLISDGAEDDDSVSQITSSVASHYPSVGQTPSLYAPTMSQTGTANGGMISQQSRTGAGGGGGGRLGLGRSRGGSTLHRHYPKRGGGNSSNSRMSGKAVQKLDRDPSLDKADGGGEEDESLANSLDEIAFILQSDDQSRRKRQGVGNVDDSLSNRDIIRDDATAEVERFGGSTSSGYELPYSVASARDRNNIYPSGQSKDPYAPTAPSSVAAGTHDLLRHILAKLRLATRYVSTHYLPKRTKVHRHDGDSNSSHSATEGDEEETDYYSMLMSPAQPNVRIKKKKMTRSERRKRVMGNIIRLVGMFCVMTLVLLGLRLAIRYGTNDVHRGNNNNAVVVRPSAGGKKGMIRGNNGQIPPSAVEARTDALPPIHRGHVIPSNSQKNDHLGTILPSVLETNLVDVTDIPTPGNGDVPLFWHIPRTGGATMNDILGGCLKLTLASDAGTLDGHGTDAALQVLKFDNQFSYVNVDTSTAEGIERAKRLNLASSGLADVVVSSLLHDASTLFGTAGGQHRGRMFTLIRHPVERAASLFHFVQDTQWRRRANFQKELSKLTIDEYFKGGMGENNWMTRFLTNELTKGQLTEDDLNVAKEILRRKCLVGLLKEKGESFARFERYFGWQMKSDADRECHEKKLQWAWPLKHRHEDVEEGTDLWDIIVAHNEFDLKLYEYAQVLFMEQAALFQ